MKNRLNYVFLFISLLFFLSACESWKSQKITESHHPLVLGYTGGEISTDQKVFVLLNKEINLNDIDDDFSGHRHSSSADLPPARFTSAHHHGRGIYPHQRDAMPPSYVDWGEGGSGVDEYQQPNTPSFKGQHRY